MITMFQAAIPPAIHGLVALGGVLAKGAAHAEAHDIDPARLLQGRLAPDMLPLIRHVQIATDMVKNGGARLAGQEPPATPDTETSFSALQDRIERTLGYLAGLPSETINTSADRTISFKVNGTPITLTGHAYLLGFVMPNLYFHTATAYNILRNQGVALEKRDFLGATTI